MSENKSKYSGIVVIIIAICVASLAASLYAFGKLDKFELLTLDYRFLSVRMPSVPFLEHLKPQKSISGEEVLQVKKVPRKISKCDVILIDMPESGAGADAGASLKDCTTAAKILTIWGAKAIVFTDLLPEPTGSAADSELIDVAISSKGIYLPALYYVGNDGGRYTGGDAKFAKEPWQILLGSTVDVGHINAFPDIDGRLRHVPVFMQYKGRRIYQLGIMAAMGAMGIDESNVEFNPEAHTLVLKTDSDELIMAVPLEEDNQLAIKWILRDGERFRKIPFRDILESYRLMQYEARPIVDPQVFKGNICILGTAASNRISAMSPLVKNDSVTSAACGVIARNMLDEDFTRHMPKVLDIALIIGITLLFGAALTGVGFLRFMMIVVVAITLFGLTSIFGMPQNMTMIIVIVLAVPLGIFIANSQIFSGMIFTALSIVGYYLIAAGIFNASGVIMPVFCPVLAMAVTFISFYVYTRFKDYLGKTRLFNLASKDGLTGLTNRRYLNMLLDAELSSAVLDKARKLSIVMCDIDNFKKLNDTHGHQAGDAILKSYARIMRSKCRQSDVVARYGGEEFVIIFPGAAAKDAFKVAEAIRQAVEEEKFVFKGQPYSTSMSMGLVQFTKEKTKEELIEKADQALYRAKKEGKNRICQ